MHKALYGLKHAPQAWYSKIDSYFTKNNFTKSANEPNFYVKSYNGEFLAASLYIDDMIYTGSSFHMVEAFKKSMMQTFDMCNLGSLNYILGIEVV